SSLLHKPHSNDYESLTRNRLARDSARVHSILSHLELTLTGSTATSSVLKPNGFETPLTSGAGQGSGEYFARLAVGYPPREYYLVTDTGSDVSWLQCSPCSECYQQSDPIFNPSASSSTPG
ncbi:pepsin-like aspartyl protease, partial [Salmonella sp. s57610]|uniref:pepsin-like aspartyl protease n=1 Tax=Salmonella sp. s57610 TaxID=3159697 RepID=UPI00397E92D3